MTARKLIVGAAMLLGTTLATTTATLAQDYYAGPNGYRYYGYAPSYGYGPYYNGSNYNTYYSHPRGGPGGLGIGLQR